jgi:non-specific protein-tyrosine kinase
MYTGTTGSEQSISLREVFRPVWKRLWIVVLVTVVCVGTALGVSLRQAPIYEASAKVLVGQEPGDAKQQGPLMGTVEGLQQLTQTMATVIYSRPVADEVIQQLGLHTTPQTFLNHLTVEQIGTTQVIELSYKDTDRERAQSIVNAVGDVSSERISDASVSSAAIKATVWERAALPTTPVSPDPTRNALLALALGLMLGIGLTFLLEHLDDSWRSAAEVEQVAEVPTFGVIPQFETMRKGRG